METKVFTKNDNGFICGNCGKEVPPLGYSSRNHCPFCLYSKHVDVNPGDRANECGGLMRPNDVAVDSKKGFVITHKCKKCGAERRNKMQADDDTALLIKLTNPYNREEYK
ncbi:MAG: RNHCP domain-containing protein [Clostridia bacterium]|nr:RNHCP domain-containing protein [Clostridia bacterium]MBQ9848586.1 RNHCP domain-containing protein [Clostridia bacterium]